MNDDVQPEELDLAALLEGGKVTAKKQQAVPGVRPARAPRPQVATGAVVMDRELIEDTSSWSDSDDAAAAGAEEGNVAAQGGGAGSEEGGEGSESEGEDEQSKTLVDPLGIHGELTTTMRYNARLDPQSVKFEAAALLAGVHYATSYDKLRAALEALRSSNAAFASGASAVKGVVDSDNFQRFVAASACVSSLLHRNVSSSAASSSPGGESIALEDARSALPERVGVGARNAHLALRSSLAGVLEQRTRLHVLQRMARFGRRYHSVLGLPQAIARATQANNEAGAGVREWRRAMRVLRGAQGPVFARVLTEVEAVMRAWASRLLERLGVPYKGDEGWAQSIEGACRALTDTGAHADPWAYFAAAQCAHVHEWSLAALSALAPAIRVAFSPLGGGCAAWDKAVCVGIDSMMKSLPCTPAMAEEARRVHALLYRCCGPEAALVRSLAALTEHLRRGHAHTLLAALRQRCRDPGQRSQWVTALAEGKEALASVLGPVLAAQCCDVLAVEAVDTLMAMHPADGPQLLRLAADARALGGAVGEGAAWNALRQLVALHARALRAIVVSGVRALLAEGNNGAATNVLSDWVSDALAQLLRARCELEGAGEAAGPVLEALTARLMAALEDECAREAQGLRGGTLKHRVLLDASFVRSALRKYWTARAEGRFRLLSARVCGGADPVRVDDELASLALLVQCFQE